MKIKIPAEPQLLRLNTAIVTRCPECRHDGTFRSVKNEDVYSNGMYLGIRSCPNPACENFLFFIWDVGAQRLVGTFPSLRIDFDASSIPGPIVNSLKEAITCHAEQCFTASAIMVRRTLEELCADRKAAGATLQDRIKALRTNVVLPQAMFDALEHLRLRGNDAAHVESKTYNVGSQEVETAIALTKEILKAVYQFDSLLGQLISLKKPP
jgi:hypothetical protein